MTLYIDPGAGTIIVQALVAAAIGTVAALRHRIRRVLRWGRKPD